MPEPLRIGVLGLSHDHIWSNLAELKAVADARLVACADPNPPLLERVKQEHGCATYQDHRKLLEAEQLDAVWLFGDNATNVELAEEAAERGLHLMVEKPMASTLEGADRILAAARAANVRLMVNWPFAWRSELQHAIALAKSGEVGRLWQVRYRAAHEGPRELGCSEYFCDWLYDPALNGGGAIIDYGCYGAVLANVMLGQASRVTAVSGRLTKEDILVDDNAFIVMSYPRAMAISEGSWSQAGGLTAYVTVFYGAEGILLVEREGRLLKSTLADPDGSPLDVPEPPPHMRSASAHFVHHLRTGEPLFPLVGGREGRDAQEVLEAALISVETGAEVSLPLKIV